MSNIDKQALREAAEKANPEQYGYYLVDAFTDLATPSTVLALLDELEAKDKQIAEHRELLRWAHDTLLEINPSNYTHDDVCEANAAAVEVILGIAPTLGETHGHTNEWWAARTVATGKGD